MIPLVREYIEQNKKVFGQGYLAKKYYDKFEEFEIEFEAQRKAEKIPDDETIMKRLAEIESKFC